MPRDDTADFWRREYELRFGVGEPDSAEKQYIEDMTPGADELSRPKPQVEEEERAA